MKNSGIKDCKVQDYPPKKKEKKKEVVIKAANFLSFKGVPSPALFISNIRGYFHPVFINLEGITLSQDLSVIKSHFECSIWVLSVMHTACNRKNAVILMLVFNVCFLLHGHMFRHKWMTCCNINVLVNKVKTEREREREREMCIILSQKISNKTYKTKYQNKELPPFITRAMV